LSFVPKLGGVSKREFNNTRGRRKGRGKEQKKKNKKTKKQCHLNFTKSKRTDQKKKIKKDNG